MTDVIADEGVTLDRERMGRLLFETQQKIDDEQGEPIEGVGATWENEDADVREIFRRMADALAGDVLRSIFTRRASTDEYELRYKALAMGIYDTEIITNAERAVMAAARISTSTQLPYPDAMASILEAMQVLRGAAAGAAATKDELTVAAIRLLVGSRQVRMIVGQKRKKGVLLFGEWRTAVEKLLETDEAQRVVLMLQEQGEAVDKTLAHLTEGHE
jgi:hypothetical protein